MRRVKLIFICAIATVLLLGCGKKKEEVVVEPPKEEAVVEKPKVVEEPEQVIKPEKPAEEQIPAGMVKSYLTGEYVPEAVGHRRPMAVMLNNIKAAVPQAGIANAGVVYEAPVEGSITRLMGIFEDYDNLEKIGSVRSCRDYYIYYALEFDALYAHFGQAAYALDYLDMENVNNLSGLGDYGDTIYYRTKDRKSPHNAYTSFAGLQKGSELMGYSQEYDPSYKGHYQFAKVGENIDLGAGVPANYVNPNYSFNKAWFDYHAEDGLYYRSQYGGPQVDELTNQQLAYKNIILEYAPWSYYDKSEYLNIETVAGGAGKYITNGKAIDITWSKDSEWGPTYYYDAAGKQITLNTGKTWVCIIQDTLADGVQITDGSAPIETPAEETAPSEIIDAE